MQAVERAYKVLYDQVKLIDLRFASIIVNNPMIDTIRTGIVLKKSDGNWGGWDERFLVLCNCGLLYFKKNED